MTKVKKSKVKPITNLENFSKQYFFALLHRRPGEPDFQIRQLNQGQCVILDIEDFERFKERSITVRKWAQNKYCTIRVHIAGHGRRRSCHSIILQLSRLLLDPAPGLICDHINHNTLDNRRCNLRAVTTYQNNWNAKPRIRPRKGGIRYKGVHKKIGHKKIRAEICRYGKNRIIGSFPGTPKGEYEASQAYDRKALELFGEFACLNHPRQKQKYLKQLQEEKLCHTQKKSKVKQ